MKHTPGPWKLLQSASYCDAVIIKSNTNEVLTITGTFDATSADLQLMAAAPELLEACRLVRGILEKHSGLYKRLNEAINKAGGND